MPTNYYNLLAKKQLCQDLKKDLASFKSANQRVILPNTLREPEYTAIQNALSQQDTRLKILQNELEAKLQQTYKPEIEPFWLASELIQKCKDNNEEAGRIYVDHAKVIANHFDTLINGAPLGEARTQLMQMKEDILKQFKENNTRFTDLMDKHGGNPTATTTSEQKGELHASLKNVYKLEKGEDLTDLNKKAQRRECVQMLKKTPATSTADLRAIAASGADPLTSLPEVVKEYLKTPDAKTLYGREIKQQGNASVVRPHLTDVGPITAMKEMVGWPLDNFDNKYTGDAYDRALSEVNQVKGGDPKAKYTQTYDEELYKGQDFWKALEKGPNELDFLFGLIRGTLYGKIPNDRRYVANAVHNDQGVMNDAVQNMKDKDGNVRNMKDEMKAIMQEYEPKIDGATGREREEYLQERSEKLNVCVNQFREAAMNAKIVYPDTGYPPKGVSPHLKANLEKDAAKKIMEQRPKNFNAVVNRMQQEITADLEKANENRTRVAFGNK